jgi:hypothetical protein
MGAANAKCHPSGQDGSEGGLFTHFNTAPFKTLKVGDYYLDALSCVDYGWQETAGNVAIYKNGEFVYNGNRGDCDRNTNTHADLCICTPNAQINDNGCKGGQHPTFKRVLFLADKINCIRQFTLLGKQNFKGTLDYVIKVGTKDVTLQRTCDPTLSDENNAERKVALLNYCKTALVTDPLCTEFCSRFPSNCRTLINEEKRCTSIGTINTGICRNLCGGTLRNTDIAIDSECQAAVQLVCAGANLDTDTCKDLCINIVSRYSCENNLNSYCKNFSTKEICACHLGTEFYTAYYNNMFKSVTSKIGRALVQSIIAIPECTYHPCSLSQYHKATCTSNQQICLADISVSGGIINVGNVSANINCSQVIDQVNRANLKPSEAEAAAKILEALFFTAGAGLSVFKQTVLNSNAFEQTHPQTLDQIQALIDDFLTDSVQTDKDELQSMTLNERFTIGNVRTKNVLTKCKSSTEVFNSTLCQMLYSTIATTQLIFKTAITSSTPVTQEVLTTKNLIEFKLLAKADVNAQCTTATSLNTPECIQLCFDDTLTLFDCTTNVEAVCSSSSSPQKDLGCECHMGVEFYTNRFKSILSRGTTDTQSMLTKFTDILTNCHTENNQAACKTSINSAQIYVDSRVIGSINDPLQRRSNREYYDYFVYETYNPCWNSDFLPRLINPRDKELSLDSPYLECLNKMGSKENKVVFNGETGTCKNVVDALIAPDKLGNVIAAVTTAVKKINKTTVAAVVAVILVFCVLFIRKMPGSAAAASSVRYNGMNNGSAAASSVQYTGMNKGSAAAASSSVQYTGMNKGSAVASSAVKKKGGSTAVINYVASFVVVLAALYYLYLKFGKKSSTTGDSRVLAAISAAKLAASLVLNHTDASVKAAGDAAGAAVTYNLPYIELNKISEVIIAVGAAAGAAASVAFLNVNHTDESVTAAGAAAGHAVMVPFFAENNFKESIIAAGVAAGTAAEAAVKKNIDTNLRTVICDCVGNIASNAVINLFILTKLPYIDPYRKIYDDAVTGVGAAASAAAFIAASASNRTNESIIFAAEIAGRDFMVIYGKGKV